MYDKYGKYFKLSQFLLLSFQLCVCITYILLASDVTVWSEDYTVIILFSKIESLVDGFP